MSFPVSKQGAPGYDKEMTEGKKHRLGTRMIFPDGRVFYYGKSSEAISAGNVSMTGALTASGNHNVDMVIPAAVAVGANQIVVTNENEAITGSGRYTGDFTTAGDFEDGYLFVNDEAGEGQIWQIMEHSSATTTGAITIDLYPNDSVRTALTTSSQVGLRKNRMATVDIFDASDITGSLVGVPTCNQTSGYYGWYQTQGPCAVLTQGTVVIGKNVMTADADGRAIVMADDSSAELYIGTVLTVGATGEFSLVDLGIRA